MNTHVYLLRSVLAKIRLGNGEEYPPHSLPHSDEKGIEKP
jgi:hypothetical protein